MTKTKLRKAIEAQSLNIAPKEMTGFVAEIKEMIFVGGRGKNWLCVCDTEKELLQIKSILKGNSYKVKYKGNGRIMITSEYKSWK
ncbi:MAG: hypothetical protein Unbinned5179contig1004_39 [Prokaryotic dsDNA virus sp.]|nr:MAG: hypothetical protein Unbinned5179contig1004_39 [Prokaryotic dsDNA virus sp.]|tara:strand:- start:579 stop:833 length:255 start_codon:yes stop_codon:yes gene_type:complete